MSKKSKVTDQTATGQAGIRKKSKVPGVMITQFMEELPEGMTTPDFTRKPIALTIQEGKFAFFKAIIVGTPTPTVTWSRANGEILFHPSVCLQKYDEATHEHTIEFPKVSPEDADTYKCFATNEYGRAVCTVVLNVIEDTVDFRKTLKKRNPDGTREQKPMETEEKVWEILLSADKKDYERICAEYGITNFRGMLKKLNEMKKEREEEVAEFVTHISSLKPIEVTDDDYATIELDMDLKDPSSKLYLYKDGVMVPFSKDEADEQKHSLKQVGKKYIFKIKKLGVEDAGLYSVDVEGVNVFSTDFKVTPVEFAVKIQEVKAEEREDALFQCVLTAPMNEIKWYGKSALLSNSEKHEITISEDKLIHKLIVRDCMPLDAGIYAAVAGIKSCNAWLIVEGENYLFFKENNFHLQSKTNLYTYVCIFILLLFQIKSSEGLTISKDGTFHRLKIHKVTEEFAGKYKFEADGRKTEAEIAVEDPPRFNAEDLEAFKTPVTVKKGHKATFNLAFIGREPIKIQWYREGEELSEEANIKIEHSEGSSRLLLLKLQRKDSGEIKIKLKNEFGTMEALSQLVVLDKPTPPMGPLEIVEASSSAVEFKWRPPKDSGGCKILNYILERQQVGRNTWKKFGPIGPEAKYRDTDVDHGRRYCYRLRVETEMGISELMETEDIQAGTKAYPGPPSAPKVVSAFKDCITLSWSPPADTGGTSILGYNLEKRKKGSNLWGPVNPPNEMIRGKQFAVKDVVEGMEYEFRVSAINNSGAGEFSSPSEFVFARDPKMRPRFTDAKIKSFMVVRAGNSKITSFNAEGTSQILIPSAERSDTGVYTIIVKNIVGQETISIEIRVTDEPKPPGPVELDENVHGTVTISWTASPDEKRDDRLHYMVTKRDSSKRTWNTIADRIFNNRFTACNIMPGREYQFRVYAKNDMGSSKPSESPKWLIPTCNLLCPPKFIVPLKTHTAPEGYECYMTCAIKGDPTPHVTWLRDSVSLNTNTNYLISNTCGVCSLLILRVGSKDTGEYKVVAENSLGRAESATKLTVRGKPFKETFYAFPHLLS
uniref:Immunoglobulin like and fibronectin type III domain containing 1, tandem duplicate 1 n=1 Tax=Astatotilapia calliptera TaxID=8154 RepID=A0A3P8N811_ASTCA